MQRWEDEQDMPGVRSLHPVARTIKLKPNIFATTARRTYQKAKVVVAIWAVFIIALTTLVTTYPMLSRAPSLVRLAPDMARQQTVLDEEFPEIENTIAIRISDNDPAKAQEVVVAVVESLKGEQQNIAYFAVPGQGPFYERYGYYYFDKQTLQAEVAFAQSYQPLLQALRLAPDFSGFSAFLSLVEKALEEGKSPRRVGDLLWTMDQTVRDQVNGSPQDINWLELTGVQSRPVTRNQVVVVLPLHGQANRAVENISQAMTILQQQFPSSQIETEFANPQPQLSPTSLSWQLLTALFLSFLLVALTVGLWRGLATAALLLMTTLTGWLAGCSLAIILSFGLSVNTFVVYGLSCLSLSVFSLIYAQTPRRLFADRQNFLTRTMLQAQKSGPLILLTLGLMAVLWSAWLITTMTLLTHLASMMLAAIVLTAASTLLLAPALSRLLPPRLHQPIFALNLGQKPLVLPIKPPLLKYLRLSLAVAMIVAGLFVTVKVAPQFFQEASTAKPQRTLQILAPDKATAVQILDLLQQEPSVTAILWAGALLPPELPEKKKILATLKTIQLGEVAEEDPNKPDTAQQLKSLAPILSNIAAKAPAESDLAKAATSLQASLSVLVNNSTDLNLSAKNLEQHVFTGLQQLPQTYSEIAQLPIPQPEQLDRPLRDFYISPTHNVWRIELAANPDYNMQDVASRLITLGILPSGQNFVQTVYNRVAQSTLELSLPLGAVLCLILIYGYFRNVILLAILTLSWMSGAGAVMLLSWPVNIHFSPVMLGAIAVTAPLIVVLSLAAARQPGWARTRPLFYLIAATAITASLPLILLGRGDIASFAKAYLMIMSVNVIIQLAVTVPLTKRGMLTLKR